MVRIPAVHARRPRRTADCPRIAFMSAGPAWRSLRGARLLEPIGVRGLVVLVVLDEARVAGEEGPVRRPLAFEDPGYARLEQLRLGSGVHDRDSHAVLGNREVDGIGMVVQPRLHRALDPEPPRAEVRL